MKQRKIITVLAVAAIAVSGLTSCASGGDSAEAGDVTVNWWTWSDTQAASYRKCIPAFEAANPGIKVEISQYAVDDYFTKLTAGFVAGTAPDAFQNSVPLLGEYAGQGQIMALDELIEESDYDLSIFDIGVDSWKFTDGKQYGIPLDWAGAAIYFNEDLVTDAGLTAEDIKTMTWNPDDGGTFDDVISRLTIDENGIRGDESGFDPENVKTYGIGTLASSDFNGQTSWNSFVSTFGWRLGGDEAEWPTSLPFDDPEFVKSMNYFRDLAARGLMPGFGEFSVSGLEQLGSGSVAMIEGGTWDATPASKIRDTKVGIAPTVEGPEGRMMISNSNANNIYAGTKHIDETWSWVTYMGTEECQTIAGEDGTFLPSIAGALQAAVDAQAEQGVDMSTFIEALENGQLYPAPPTTNGQELTDSIQPMFEAYFTGERDDDVFADMTAKTEEILVE
ncbi:ABC transporter substrate-binding protein [Glaciibacter superstes]|uniref:ABC transporter substrate-binding protein n=1 Tax=Glaciibacter superstes TaxID=501023 RepID=UPI0003B32DD8|nr:sugar ABC transporter substrate-binding protein [Glaciibacter superstes]